MLPDGLAKNRLSSEMPGALGLSAIRPDLDRIVPLWLVCGMLLLFAAGAAGQLALHDLVLLFMYGYLVCVVSLLLVRRGDGTYSLLFLLAIIVRLAVVVLLEAFPPDSPSSAIRYVSGTVFEDETYYLRAGRWLGESLSALQGTNLSNAYERVAAYYGLVHLVAGPESIWGRLSNVFVGALTVVAIYDLILRQVGTRIRKWAWWFAALSPVLVLWAVSFLKEVLLALGVTLVVNAIVRIRSGHFAFVPMLMIATGAIICFWARSAVLLPLVAPLVLSVFVLKGKASRKSTAFLPVGMGLTILLLLAVLSPLEVAERGLSLVGSPGVGTLDISVEAQQRGGIGALFPFFDVVMRWSGALRVIGFTLFLMLSPVVTSLWSLIPVVGRPSWQVFGVTAYAASWWICLPFWLRSAYDAVRQRDTWWLTWAGGFVIWSVLAAYARFGVGYDAFRYRDAMVPVIMLLAAKGLETTLLEWRQGGIWPRMLRGYWMVVGALILLRGLGVLRLT